MRVSRTCLARASWLHLVARARFEFDPVRPVCFSTCTDRHPGRSAPFTGSTGVHCATAQQRARHGQLVGPTGRNGALLVLFAGAVPGLASLWKLPKLLGLNPGDGLGEEGGSSSA